MKRLCVVLGMPIVAATLCFSLPTTRANAAHFVADTCTPGDCETHGCVPPQAQTCNPTGGGWGSCAPCTVAE